MRHEVPIRNKLYVLKNVAHSLRAEIFNEKLSKKGKFQAMFWQQGVMGKMHIKDMDYNETIRLIAELYSKKKDRTFTFNFSHTTRQ